VHRGQMRHKRWTTQEASYSKQVVARSIKERPMEVEIWSDVACPWCYIGKRRFEADEMAT